MILESEILNKELTQKEKISISLVDVAKIIKKQLKKEFPLCDFSIQTQFYSGGCSLHIAITKTNFKVILPFEQLSEKVIFSLTQRNYKIEDIKNLQSKKYHQLSHFVEDVYNPEIWNNGVFLTLEGYNLVKRVIELTNKFNWDNSDAMSDYFDVNFYLNLSLGKWNKDLIEGEQ